MIVVAIGDGVNESDLRSMTKFDGKSMESHDHYFHVDDTKKLTSVEFIENSIEGCNLATGTIKQNIIIIIISKQLFMS